MDNNSNFPASPTNNDINAANQQAQNSAPVPTWLPPQPSAAAPAPAPTMPTVAPTQPNTTWPETPVDHGSASSTSTWTPPPATTPSMPAMPEPPAAAAPTPSSWTPPPAMPEVPNM